MFKITAVQDIRKATKDGPCKGWCNVVLDDALVLGGCAILTGEHGLYVGMPSKLHPKRKKWMNMIWLTGGRDSYTEFSDTVLSLLKKHPDYKLLGIK
jgi:DNA-binding cell septation regulator SpoVG